eukprot:UN05562
MFKQAVIGRIHLDAKLSHYPTTDEYKLVYVIQTNPETIVLTKTHDSAQSSCFMPSQTQNWKKANIHVPFYSISHKLETPCTDNHLNNCVDIQAITDMVEEGGACFGYYDTDNQKFVEAGDFSVNVEYVWDGDLRINDWKDFSVHPSHGCAKGSEFLVFDSQDSYVVSWKCSGVYIGESYTMFIPCPSEIRDNLDGCPFPFSMNQNGDIFLP